MSNVHHLPVVVENVRGRVDRYEVFVEVNEIVKSVHTLDRERESRLGIGVHDV
jgi:hypothetical protein